MHTGFALAASSETLALFAPSISGLVLQDLLTFGLQLTDLSLGRSPDGGTNRTLNLPTPNTPNQAQPLGNPAKLKVNEWMANPATGDPWFELYNDDAGRLLTAHPIGLDRRIEQRRNESNYVILITKSAVALWLPCVHFWFSGSP